MILLIIPLTIYLVQQNQNNRSNAAQNTRLSFSPDSNNVIVGESTSFTISISPDTNLVKSIKLVIKYDETKLSTDTDSFIPDPNSNLVITQGPIIENGTFTVDLETTDTNFINTNTDIGSITFNAIDGPDPNSQISFDSTATQITANESADPNENVFLSGDNATVNITDGSILTSTPTPISELNINSGSNKSPICTSLDIIPNEDTGTAPYSLMFTAKGSDSDGTISNIKFTFEPNKITNVASDSSKAVSIAKADAAHIYTSEGTFTASAILTDNQGATSDSVNCTKIITIEANNVTTNNSNLTTASANDANENDLETDAETNAAPETDDSELASGAVASDYSDSSSSDEEVLASDTSLTPMPATGPNDKIIGVGALGGILFLIGALLFFAL